MNSAMTVAKVQNVMHGLFLFRNGQFSQNLISSQIGPIVRSVEQLIRMSQSALLLFDRQMKEIRAAFDHFCILPDQHFARRLKSNDPDKSQQFRKWRGPITLTSIGRARNALRTKTRTTKRTPIQRAN
jgi:hypothetical protein